ncbi:MAG: 3-deoxy-7-phosphoheptulonate synthase [Planctomycetes bacterium]|nr:3-deoxy-7-phosphoheptulonate synthase [Planctomycetota bacterium]
MLIVMHQQASSEQVDAVLRQIRDFGLEPHPIPGKTRTAIGITGNVSAIDPTHFEGLEGVKECIRVTKPYKLASREMKVDDTYVDVADATIGKNAFTVIAGPCSVENETMILRTAEFLRGLGVRLLRGGAYKPRTSPYAFQGLGADGLELLAKARERTGIGIVTEIMDASQLAEIAPIADMLQIGARNMQNFTLLKAVSRSDRPVLLKRGISATLEEWLMAAEYILSGGNARVAMCERGVRTFADHSRNTLDLSVIPPLQALSHLPIVVDPSHGTGHRAYVGAMAKAALAAGAHGLMIEVHPDPARALSDGAQSLDFGEFQKLWGELRTLADALGRPIA